LAGRLEERDVRVVAADRNSTESHTILLAGAELGSGKDVAVRLEAADIMASYSSLPAEYGKDCVRMGTSEVTRLGAQAADMVAAADIVADVLLGNIEPEAAKARVHQWSERLGDVRYRGL
jgi:glycine hydroxymethyltransferase